MNQQQGQNPQQQKGQANQFFQQAQNNANNTQFETASELAQSSGQISQILASQKLVGLEIGGIGQASPDQYQNQNQNQYQNQAQLEVDQAAGPVSQKLSQQSKV